ncbi:PR-1-like protein [Glonium stellatum]|uniref:PR-1-like protein n=1 Tax=Glonium stellatum TaxID=574774 RepID=A0A8E2EUM8_9PEZI|nr:PR-1-like protein [Glonium stellatum]
MSSTFYIRSLLLPLVCSLLPFVDATPAITVTVSAPVSTSTEYTNPADFKNAVLNGTNTYRAQHNATAMAWNQSLAGYAANWGEACIFKHSNWSYAWVLRASPVLLPPIFQVDAARSQCPTDKPRAQGGPYGENLASGYPNAIAAVAAWGDERDHYDFAAAQFSETTGHFTQLVWKSSKSTGCSATNCEGKGDGSAPGWFVVCEYYPLGNVIGEFKQNVQSKVEGQGGKCLQGAVCAAAGTVRADILGKWQWFSIWGVIGLCLL